LTQNYVKNPLALRDLMSVELKKSYSFSLGSRPCSGTGAVLDGYQTRRH
jgi:hypothetical protein